MRISEMNERIEFVQVPDYSQATNGDLSGAEVVLFSCWAKVSPLRGMRRMQAEQIQSGAPYEITTRYSTVLENTADYVIKWNNRRLKVQGIPVVEDAKWKKIIINAYQQ